MSEKPSRRGFIVGGAAALGAAAVGAVTGAGFGYSAGSETSVERPPAPAPTTVPFDGPHQAGIAGATPAHAVFLAFDLAPGADRAGVARVFGSWTAIGRSLAAGDASADPTLITAGSDPGLFTMTVGVGADLLDSFGIARPAPLVDLPAFRGDQIVEQDSRGSVVVQLCSNDAVFAAGGARALRAAAHGVLLPRWQMNGFRGAAASTSTSNGRNLMGQIDGTNNIAVSRESLGGPVWIDAAQPAWMTGGTYMAIRRFEMKLSDWEAATSDARDRTIGRHLGSGAPLGGAHESDPVDLAATASDGSPVIPADAHIRLAAPRLDAGEEMLRRSYSYSSGQGEGGEQAGLIFVSFQSDPTRSFIPVQQRLAEGDALNRFTVATSSSLFAILPGATGPEDWLGRSLLA